jgi:class 3 adenylate cyclase/Tfp pilus assembly protein PilF
MTTPGDKSSGSRRLAAVWFADIVGFTRLAAENDTLALRLVETLQAAATAAVESHEGTVVKFTGDGVLAEFASAAGAALGGIQLLLRFSQLTEDWPEGPHQIRLGMHLGDVTVGADGDIYGDGVNRAARLEGLAEPGRLLVSEDVYRQLRNRPELILTELGVRTVKGYDDPLLVYDAEPTGKLAATLLREATTPEPAAQATHPRRSVRPIAVGLAVGILSFVTLALWTAMGTPSSDTLPLSSGAGADATTTAGEIPTAGGAPTVDAPTANGTPTTNTTPAANATTTADSPPTVDPRVAELLRRGRDQLSQGTPRSMATAAELFTRSIELAPDDARAHLGLAEAQMGLGKTGVRRLGEVLPLARGHLEDAIRHDADLAEAHAALASLLGTFLWDWEGAEREFETALDLAPSPAVHRAFAELLSSRGRHDEALAQVAMASSREPGAVANVGAQGLALFRARSYARARVALTEALRLDPTDDRIRVHLARTQGMLGERQQARSTLEGTDSANRSPYLQVWSALFRPTTPGAGQARGNQLVRTLRRTLGPSEARNPDAPYNLASLQLVLGDQAGAAESLQRAVRTPSPSLIWLATDPLWDPVRSDPDFERLVRLIDAGGRTP